MIRIRAQSLTSLLVAGALVSGCATLRADVQDEFLAPLEMALTGTPDQLAGQAATGDPTAQIAYALVLEHGFHGVTPSWADAARLRDLAMAPRGTTPITQYTAAFDGRPSRVNLIYVPAGGISPAQLGVIRSCVSDLQLAGGAGCGQGDRAQAIRAHWFKAVSLEHGP